MEINQKSRVVSALIKDLDKNKISLTHRLQRKSVWSTRQKSLLIDSILKGYRFYPIFISREKEIDYVVDGVQRISAIRSYINDEFRLGRDCGPIIVKNIITNKDGEQVIKKTPFDVAGKKFSKLDPEMQELILNYELSVLVATDASDEEIREMFRRLNNGSVLNNSQKNVVDYSYDFLGQLNKCLENEFWGKTGISATDIKKDKDREVLLQCLYVVSGEEIMGFKDANIHAFSKRLQEKGWIPEFNAIYDLLDAFNDVFDRKISNFNKMSIAPVFAGANEFVTINESDGYHVYDLERLNAYAKKIRTFFEDEYIGSDYAEQLKTMGGTAGKENVMYRINYFTEMAKSC